MKYAKVSAIFSGENHSMGYKTQKSYHFTLVTSDLSKILIVPDNNHPECDPCVYDDAILFLQNWANVTYRN